MQGVHSEKLLYLTVSILLRLLFVFGTCFSDDLTLVTRSGLARTPGW